MFETPLPDLAEAPAAAPAPMPPLPEIASEVVDRAQIINGTPLVKYSATEAGLIALKAELAGKVYDLKTTKGDQAARADRLRCVTLRTTLEKRRKDFKAPALAYGKLIDTEAARITAEIEALEAPIDAQIKADEQRRAAEKEERERIEREAAERHAARRSAIAMYALRCQEPGMTAERISNGMKALEAADMADADPARAAELAELQGKTLETMRTLHAQALAREQEAARQELIRQENERQAEANRIEAARIAAEAEAVRRAAAELAAREAAAREAEQRQRDEAAAAELLRQAKELMERQDAERPPADAPATLTIHSFIPGPPPVFAESADFGVVAIDAAPAADLARESQIHAAGTAAMQAEARKIDAPRVVLLEEPAFDPVAELQALAAEARASRFPSQPNMGVEWWARFYAIADSAA